MSVTQALTKKMDSENRPSQSNSAQPVALKGGRLKLPHSLIVRAPGLLPMLYTPNEIADELGISVRSVREWLEHGLPHQRDARKRIWIEGRQLAAWVVATKQIHVGQPLGDDEAYCFKCRKPVKLLNPESVLRGKRALLSGKCPACGSLINRGSRHGQS